MKVKREVLIQHLQRIACGNQVLEAVFTGAFATVALTPDNHLMVSAPPLPKTRVLLKKGESMGIADLDRLSKSLTLIAGSGKEAVDVEIRLEEHRFIIDEGARGVLELMTAAPKTIGTRVEEEVVEKLMAKAPSKAKGGGIALTRMLVEGIRNTFNLYKATELEMFVGKDGGRIQVGDDNSDRGKFEAPELKAPTAYSLLFGSHFVDVLGIITNYSEAALYLGGANKFVMIEDGAYKYMLSPLSKGADA